MLQAASPQVQSLWSREGNQLMGNYTQNQEGLVTEGTHGPDFGGGQGRLPEGLICYG